jgi:hypothetical protein
MQFHARNEWPIFRVERYLFIDVNFRFLFRFLSNVFQPCRLVVLLALFPCVFCAAS